MRIKLCLAVCALVVVASARPVGAHDGPHEISMDLMQNTATTSTIQRPLLRNASITPDPTKAIGDVKKDFRSEMIEKRAAAKQTAETRKEAFRQKVADMQDMQKKAVLQRMDTRFTNTNDAFTDKWAESLEEMNGLVDRVGSEAADLEATGVDTTAVDASVTRARTAITTAQTAVATQAGKSYVFSITTEATVKTAASSVVTQFRTDIRSTFLLVQNAKQAVRSAVVALKTAKSTPAEPTPVASDSAIIGE